MLQSCLVVGSLGRAEGSDFHAAEGLLWEAQSLEFPSLSAPIPTAQRWARCSAELWAMLREPSPGKGFCSRGRHEAERILPWEREDLSLGNQKYSCWTTDITHRDLEMQQALLRDRRVCQHTRHRLHALAWGCHICSCKCSGGRGWHWAKDSFSRLREEGVEEKRCVSIAVLHVNVTWWQAPFLLTLRRRAGASTLCSTSPKYLLAAALLRVSQGVRIPVTWFQVRDLAQLLLQLIIQRLLASSGCNIVLQITQQLSKTLPPKSNNFPFWMIRSFLELVRR